jgi:hypothetical protein
MSLARYRPGQGCRGLPADFMRFGASTWTYLQHRRSYDSATLARSKSRRSIPFESPRPSTHPFKPGDEVIVYRVISCSRIVEPIADAPHLYQVRSVDERRPLRRFVHAGDWQQDPEGMLAALMAHWRAAKTPEILEQLDFAS